MYDEAEVEVVEFRRSLAQAAISFDTSAANARLVNREESAYGLA